MNKPSYVVSVHLGGEPRLDHVAILELHGLRTLGTQFSRDNDLTTFGVVLHNKAENAIAGAAHSKSAKKLYKLRSAFLISRRLEQYARKVTHLVAERLSLCLGAESTVHDTLGVELHRPCWEVETLLHNGGKLADALSLEE